MVELGSDSAAYCSYWGIRYDKAALAFQSLTVVSPLCVLRQRRKNPMVSN